jgi:hypothetical protein
MPPIPGRQKFSNMLHNITSQLSKLFPAQFAINMF